jgi:hypothetical protein
MEMDMTNHEQLTLDGTPAATATATGPADRSLPDVPRHRLSRPC